MPEMEMWTFNTDGRGEGDVKRMGINFGAPGDRVADNGTLWMDYPSVGGPSPDVEITVNPEGAAPYRNHASRIADGELPWVAASGLEDCRDIRIRLSKTTDTTQSFTVRLLFAETGKPEPGARVFDIALQGQPALPAFDIAKEAAGSWRTVVKEFHGVSVSDLLTITLTPAEGSLPPIFSGVEVLVEDAA